MIAGTSSKAVLAACHDFKTERNLLQQLILDSGHVHLSSPITHAEIAGDGVEYDWGMSKKAYRRSNTGGEREMASKQEERVLSSLGPENLSRRRMFRCSRKAREYKRVYLKKADAPFSHAEIENGRAEVKAARLACTHTHHRSAPAADVAEIETAA